MKVDTTLIEKALAQCERMDNDLFDTDGIGASTLRLVVDAIGGVIKEQHPRFNTGAFQIACLPLQSERQKQAILRALEADERRRAGVLTPVEGARPQYDDDGREIVRVVTCGTCGRSWNDAAISGVTPTPSGRCPFEYEHTS